MRHVLAAILVLVLPTWAAAQSARHRDEPASLPAIGLPLPQIGLPLPTLGLPAPQPAPRASRPTPRPGKPGRPPRGGGKGHKPPAAVFIGPGYYPWYDEPEPPPPAPEPQPAPEPYSEPAPVTGTLHLEVQPSTGLQFFADGFYVGTSEDLNNTLALEPGPHRVEIRAPGYETASVDVKVDAGRTITYRGALTPAGGKAAEPPARVEPAAKKPVYFIPGCYLGNVPPKDAGLPATCDLSKAVLVSP